MVLHPLDSLWLPVCPCELVVFYIRTSVLKTMFVQWCVARRHGASLLCIISRRDTLLWDTHVCSLIAVIRYYETERFLMLFENKRVCFNFGMASHWPNHAPLALARLCFLSVDGLFWQVLVLKASCSPYRIESQLQKAHFNFNITVEIFH